MDLVRQIVGAGLAIAVAWAGDSRAGTAAQRIGRWQPFIAEAAGRFGIPPGWIEAVMQAESGGRAIINGRSTESKAGALGLMQVMPQTYAEMRQIYGLGADPHDPRDNILAGTAYLRAMLDRFGYPGLFAAYHAGPSRYTRHLSTGETLPTETISYLGVLENQSLPGVKSVAQTAPAGQLNSVNLATGNSLFFIRNSAPVGERQLYPSFR